MTLRRKMTLQIAAMIGGLLVVIVVALSGLNGLRSDFGTATSGYRSLRDVYEVAAHVAGAKTLLAAGDHARAAAEIDRALARVELLASHESDRVSTRFGALLKSSLQEAATVMQLPPDEAFHAGTRTRLDALDGVLGQVAKFALDVRQSIENHEKAAERKWRATILLVATVSASVVLVAVLLGIRQYRGVARPLLTLRAAADRFAAGELADRIDSDALKRSALEFGKLGEDFNRMARELETLYRDLERKVADKSRELVRSERLASVGYLAAGVAHEINNPLSVITGYGERAMAGIERGGRGESAIANTLKVMCEEAYRCKAITDRLLSLARPSEAKRAAVDAVGIAREVVALVEGLPVARSKSVRLNVTTEEAFVVAADGELKQVLLNLLLNALDALSAGGEVIVSVARVENIVRLTVLDNGRGMTGETLDRAFEPFFTEKRGVQSAGTGLGLSISHAIVESHGGRLTAASDGPDQGSRFTLELPPAIPAGAMP